MLVIPPTIRSTTLSQFGIDKFTTRSREAIEAAQLAATTAGNSSRRTRPERPSEQMMSVSPRRSVWRVRSTLTRGSGPIV